jgi:hypothetical protein
MTFPLFSLLNWRARSKRVFSSSTFIVSPVRVWFGGMGGIVRRPSARANGASCYSHALADSQQRGNDGDLDWALLRADGFEDGDAAAVGQLQVEQDARGVELVERP